MNAGLSWLHAPVWLPLVHALLHTLWQGALTAGGLALALRLIPARQAGLRYGLSTAALVLVLLLGLGSWALLDASRRSSADTAGSEHAVNVAVGRLPGNALTIRAGTTPAWVGRSSGGAEDIQRGTMAAGSNGAPRAWVRWVAVSWLMGVGLSLLRAATGAVGAERLRRRCRALADPHLLALAEEMKRRLGLTRRVRFLVSEEIVVPSVMGAFWPAVLLPATLLTGVPPELLRAILAHELAHIRRWDYLANLAQMFVEAFLFFNPFVWWISRQVRLEREACCDRVAAEECQSPARYVEALVAVIEGSRFASAPAAPMLAVSGPNAHRDHALERVRRLLVPGYQPVLRLRWFSLVAVLALSGLVLGGLSLGTRAVAQTINMTAPKAAPTPASAPPAATDHSAAYHVRAVMADGSPLRDGPVTIHYHDQYLNAGSWSDFSARPDGSATVNVQTYTLSFTVAATKEGCAAVFAGPFTPLNMGALEGLELKLTPGYAAAIETMDEAGRPIAGALLTGLYPGPPEVKFGDLKTDASGVATLAHLGEAPLNVQVRADGFQGDEIKSIHLDPANPYRWTLKKTPLLPGRVTVAGTGQPIAGAVVRLAYVRGRADENYLWPGSGPILATTDAQGRFTLGSLRADSRYWFDVDAPGHGGAFVGVVTLADGELNVALGPELSIRGKVIHIPPAMIENGRFSLGYNQEFLLDGGHAGAACQGAELTPVNGEAEFSVGPFYRPSGKDADWNGTMEWARTNVFLSIDSARRISFQISDLPQSGAVLDLAENPPSLKFAADPATDTPAAQGQPAAAPSAKEASGPKQMPPAVKELSNKMLAAARAGNLREISRLIAATYQESHPPEFKTEDAGKLLDQLTGLRELSAFTMLYDRFKETNYLGHWKPADELLVGLVRDGRRDWLEALVTRGLSLERLSAQTKIADPPMAGWITGRVAEITRQRADIEALGKAAGDGDLSVLQRLFETGADVNGVSKDDNTPLIRAVFKNRLEAAQWLLDHGAQVDKPRLPGWNFTPLCLVNSVPMAELLKKSGANVHAKLYERDESILTYVARSATGDLVTWFLQQGLDAKAIDDNQENMLFGLKDGASAEALLKAGADPNQVDRFGYTPLSAAHSGKVVQALVRHGADLHPKLKDGVTLLEMAAANIPQEHGTPEDDASTIEELIKQGAEFDLQGNGVRAMIQAAYSDRVGAVRVFLDHGVSPNASYQRGDEIVSALYRAAMQAPKSLQLLLERGADPNAPVPADRLSPLGAALATGAFANVDLLRQAGAKGVSDLAYYSAKGDLAKVKELLNQNADPNEAATAGFTPLSFALRHAQVEIARLLLDHGASVNAFDASGFSPYLDFLLHRQLIDEDPGQAKMLWQLSLQEAKARLSAFEELFAQHPPDRTYRDAAGRTALQQAAWTGTSFAVGLMLGQEPLRFDPNLPDNEGKTALLLAALSPVAKDLADAITISDPGAPTQSWNRQADIALRLLKAGARLDLVGPGGKTIGELALQAARDAHNAQLAEVLTTAGADHPGSGNSGSEKSFLPSIGAPTPGNNARPTPVASSNQNDPTLPYKVSVTPQIEKSFRGTDAIDIRAITGTGSTFEVGHIYRVTGTCRQQSLPHATLYIGNTADAGSDAIAPLAGSSLSKALPSGTTEFDCTFKLLRPGTLHVTIYDLDNADKINNAYAGIYLGDVVDPR